MGKGKKSRGIGIEIDELYKEIPNLFEGYTVEYYDFRDYLNRVNSRFDTIIVDVYDEKGYVDEAYDIEWIEKYLSFRNSEGKVVFHCIDMIGSILAANTPIPQTPTVLSTMVRRIRKVTDYILHAFSTPPLEAFPPMSQRV